MSLAFGLYDDLEHNFHSHKKLMAPFIIHSPFLSPPGCLSSITAATADSWLLHIIFTATLQRVSRGISSTLLCQKAVFCNSLELIEKSQSFTHTEEINMLLILRYEGTWWERKNSTVPCMPLILRFLRSLFLWLASQTTTEDLKISHP